MKNSFLSRALRALAHRPAFSRRHAFNADAVRSTVQRALDAAGMKPSGGSAADIGATIDRALAAAGLQAPAHDASAERVTASIVARQPASEYLLPAVTAAPPALAGQFVSRSFTGRAGGRLYKLYIPSQYDAHDARQLPLVVMLHGCTQSADDFAAGTGMNVLAEQHGFLVAYPEQASDANPSRCWNWFRAGDQQRDSGEPSLIAGITREIAGHYRVDERRIYVAGMSAGAAMAVVLAAAYPELYAAVGAHSGLPHGAAHDVASAFVVMKNGGAHASTASRGGGAVPTIVFHGDTDATVSSRNAQSIVDQALSAHAASDRLRASTQEGTSGGRRYVRICHAEGEATMPHVEHWIIRGGGHAWSGGNPAGSYTDAGGPDASAEFVRFFLGHAR